MVTVDEIDNRVKDMENKTLHERVIRLEILVAKIVEFYKTHPRESTRIDFLSELEEESLTYVKEKKQLAKTVITK